MDFQERRICSFNVNMQFDLQDMSVNLYKLNKYVLYYPVNTFKLHSTKKVKLYLVDWMEFYQLGGILPFGHLVKR